MKVYEGNCPKCGTLLRMREKPAKLPSWPQKEWDRAWKAFDAFFAKLGKDKQP